MTLYDSYSIFIILSLCCQEKLIMTVKDKVEDDEENAVTTTKPMPLITINTPNQVKTPPCVQESIDDSSLSLFNQCDKISPLLSSISPHALSNRKLKWNYFKSTFCLHSSLVGDCLFVPIPKPGDVVFNQICNVSNIITYIGDYSSTAFNKSYRFFQIHIVFSLMLSIQNYFTVHCYTGPLQECLLVFVKSQVYILSRQYLTMYSILPVSFNVTNPNYIVMHCYY